MGLLGRKRALSSADQEEEGEKGFAREAKKTRGELMEEIIAKSKMFKVRACVPSGGNV